MKRILICLLLLGWAVPMQAQPPVLSGARAVGRRVSAPVQKLRVPPPVRKLRVPPQVSAPRAKTPLPASAANVQYIWGTSAGARPFSVAKWVKKHLVRPPVPLSGVSDRALEKEVKRSYAEVKKLWKRRFGDVSQVPLLTAVFRPSKEISVVSVRSNRISYLVGKEFADKIDWLRARPGQGRQELQRLSGKAGWNELVQNLSREKLIMLGEQHYNRGIQDTVLKLVGDLKRQNPSRRVVLFTEFLYLPAHAAGSRNTLATYYRRPDPKNLRPVQQTDKMSYAPHTLKPLIQAGVEVYPLEDKTQKRVFNKEMRDGFITVLAMTQRNKNWARVMEAKMAEIQKADPDALFVVYAGLGHTSWLGPMSLPKFFAPYSPAVVEFGPQHPSVYNTLFTVWGASDPFFQPTAFTMHRWQGPDARVLAQKTGFDYMVAAPDYFNF